MLLIQKLKTDNKSYDINEFIKYNIDFIQFYNIHCELIINKSNTNALTQYDCNIMQYLFKYYLLTTISNDTIYSVFDFFINNKKNNYYYIINNETINYLLQIMVEKQILLLSDLLYLKFLKFIELIELNDSLSISLLIVYVYKYFVYLHNPNNINQISSIKIKYLYFKLYYLQHINKIISYINSSLSYNHIWLDDDVSKKYRYITLSTLFLDDDNILKCNELYYKFNIFNKTSIDRLINTNNIKYFNRLKSLISKKYNITDAIIYNLYIKYYMNIISSTNNTNTIFVLISAKEFFLNSNNNLTDNNNLANNNINNSDIFSLYNTINNINTDTRYTSVKDIKNRSNSIYYSMNNINRENKLNNTKDINTYTNSLNLNNNKNHLNLNNIEIINFCNNIENIIRLISNDLITNNLKSDKKYNYKFIIVSSEDYFISNDTMKIIKNNNIDIVNMDINNDSYIYHLLYLWLSIPRCFLITKEEYNLKFSDDNNYYSNLFKKLKSIYHLNNISNIS